MNILGNSAFFPTQTCSDKRVEPSCDGTTGSLVLLWLCWVLSFDSTASQTVLPRDVCGGCPLGEGTVQACGQSHGHTAPIPYHHTSSLSALGCSFPEKGNQTLAQGSFLCLSSMIRGSARLYSL